MYTILPLEIFGLSFYSFDELLKFFNNAWLIQIAVCFYYCIKTKQYFPTLNLKSNIFINQIYVYFLMKSIIYVSQIIFTESYYFRFEDFLHHIAAISLFLQSYFNPNVISACYLFPFLVHSIYWSYSGSYSDQLLAIYNMTLLICTTLITIKSYNTKKKIVGIKILITSALLFNVNLVGYFYGYNIRIFELDTEKFFESIMLSLFVSLPYYFYLVYVNFELKLNKTFMEINLV